MSDFTQSSALRHQSSISEGDWVYAEPYQGPGKVIEKSSLWGTGILRVWFPPTDTVVRLRSEQVSTQSSVLSTHYLTYVASAARVADALTQDVLLAPIESSVIPLPHQIQALSRAIAGAADFCRDDSWN